ncbi:HNH endonuclease [Caballeronia arationis]|uniref:HNH endonuclease n=1 Tax=Caballeronia arationis TaxID=1777142 RepID=A0A7Z7I9T3_9BURK|nr:HNH endonuclease [Caballeronia arationis]SOE81974.1 HNH endonuclease [Caballeronia arationis]
MNHIEFREDNAGFLEWTSKNPHGFVLNVFPENRKRTKIHRASCSHLKEIGSMHLKVCATQPFTLADWGKVHHFVNGHVPFCGACLRGMHLPNDNARPCSVSPKPLASPPPLIHFQNDEAGYNAWLLAHPDGFVMNVRHPPEKHRLILHKATCGNINDASVSDSEAPFTGGKYSKVCSLNHALIANWARDSIPGVTGYTHLCKNCKPDAPPIKADEVEKQRWGFERAVAISLDGGVEARRKRLAEAPTKPTVTYAFARLFQRNPDVVAEVLHNANGKCQGCGKAAPFHSKATGKPYLEVHHRTPLAEGGEDTVANAVALCPNCHRQQHFG